MRKYENILGGTEKTDEEIKKSVDRFVTEKIRKAFKKIEVGKNGKN